MSQASRCTKTQYNHLLCIMPVYKNNVFIYRNAWLKHCYTHDYNHGDKHGRKHGYKRDLNLWLIIVRKSV